MPVHDAFARITPYELSFPELGWARERFRAVREEARARGTDTGDAALFALLGEVGAMLHELLLPEEGLSRGTEHAIILYHAFHFWAAREPLYLLETGVVRQLLDGTAAPSWGGEAPGAAGYVQLPQHLLWTEEGRSGGPESVDGFFWTAPPGRGELSVLLAAGIRTDRPGLSIVALPPAPLHDAPEWTAVVARHDGRDFESAMPGSELEGLYQVRTSGEVIKLVARTLARLCERPGRDEQPPETAGPPAPTRLPYRRVAAA